MSNEKEGLGAEFASQSVEGISYKLPAIRIIERYGRKEIELEFATADDYAAYKRIESESLMADKQKYDAAVRSDRISSEDTIKRLYDIVERLSKSSLI